MSPDQAAPANTQSMAPQTASVTPDTSHHPRDRSPLGPPAVGALITRAMWVPTVLMTVSVLAALWSLISLFLHAREFEWVRWVTEAFYAANIPVGPGILEAVIFAILAIGAVRRKRIALYFFLFLQLINGLSAGLDLADVTGLTKPEIIVRAISIGAALASIPFVIWARPAFPGRILKGSLLGALAIVATGLGLNTLFGLLAIHMGSWRHEYTQGTQWVLSRVFGILATAFMTSPGALHGPRGLGIVLSFWSAVVTILALVYFLRSQRMPGRTPADDLYVRGLLSQWGQDSLGYFATRDDRSVVASSDGRAGVSYGVAVGVSMVGGDPLGDPQSWDNAITQWRAQCAQFGWIPAALSVSEAGARAFRNHGFMVKSMGDEAVIHTNRFDINAPQMRPLAQAVRRARRAGIDISIRQLKDIDEDERRELVDAAKRYRQGDERGFSMSLERILEPIDGRMTVVLARGQDGGIHALLTLAPWGNRGVSLTLMRRNPSSVNGIVEAMVVALIEHGRDTNIDRISLNFAMFRRVFEQGLAVDASWSSRLTRRIMLVASRFWQLDSLYESNARYQPEWVPRYICYPSITEATAVVVAAGVLEGFLPQWGTRTWQHWRVTPEHLERVREIEAQAVADIVPQRRLSEQARVRRAKAQALEARGMEPWPPGVSLGELPGVVGHWGAHLHPGEYTDRLVESGGRIVGVRDHGKVIFVDLEREGADIQVVLDQGIIGEPAMDLFGLADRGDLIAVAGTLARTRRGEVSVIATSWTMAAKTLRPLPPRGTELDPRTRTRERVLAFLTDPSAVDLLRKRSRALSEVRTVLSEEGYLEVETPMLHSVKGGANARPFVTHMNAYGTDVFMRIAPELYLKRLAVGGMDAIFEMGRSFRNEGADATHNPEFTSLEAYKAGGDYTTMRELTETLIKRAAVAVNGAEFCLRPAGSIGVEDAPVIARLDGVDLAGFDLSGEWPVVSVHQAITREIGRRITPDTPIDELVELCKDHGIDLPPVLDDGSLIGALYDELVEANTVFPTFYTDFPKSSSPLTRKHRADPRLAERWDLVAFGMELGTAYTELTDPIDQRERFVQQSLAAAAGDPEAMSIDTTFLDDLELGLAPTGGLGIGMDRMVMLLTGTSIRQILAFPFVRPLTSETGS